MTPPKTAEQTAAEQFADELWPERLAEWSTCIDAYLAGYRARDAEVANLVDILRKCRETIAQMQDALKIAEAALAAVPAAPPQSDLQLLREGIGALSALVEHMAAAPPQITDEEITGLWNRTMATTHILSGESAVHRFAHALLAAPADRPRCIGYPDCDGDLVATPHSAKCPLYATNETQPPGR